MTDGMNHDDPFSDPTAFFLDSPLYRPYPFNGVDVFGVKACLGYRGTYDSWCIHCSRDSTFTLSEDSTSALARALSRGSADDCVLAGAHVLKGNCSRCRMTTEFFVFLVKGDDFAEPVSKGTITKIGQYPSAADLTADSHRRYRPILGAVKTRELTKACGLFAHGVGAGSLVYLRRIFEHLLEDAQGHAQDESAELDFDAIQTMRIADKIHALREFLPTMLVENRAIYSDLSAGIHTHNEERCLDSFEPLLECILLILEERLEKYEKQKRKQAVTQSLNKLRSQ